MNVDLIGDNLLRGVVGDVNRIHERKGTEKEQSEEQGKAGRSRHSGLEAEQRQ